MTTLLDEPANLLFFELMSVEMNTSFNVHAGIKIDQFCWSLPEMRKISGLRRRKFKRAFSALLSSSILKKREVTINTPTGVSKQTAYQFNADLSEVLLDKWRVLLHIYWQIIDKAVDRPYISR